MQFDAFLDGIAARRPAGPTGEDGRAALKVALAILDKIKEHAEVVSQTLVAGWKP